MINRLKFEIEELVESILDHLPNSLFESESTTFLDPAMGGGQFVHAIEKRLKDCGHSDENIKDRVFGYENNMLSVGYAVNRLGLVGTYDVVEYKDFLESDMHKKFDVVVGNPPYSLAGNKSGKKGRAQNLYPKFYEKAIEIADYVSMIVPNTSRQNYCSFNSFVREHTNKIILIDDGVFNVNISTWCLIKDRSETNVNDIDWADLHELPEQKVKWAKGKVNVTTESHLLEDIGGDYTVFHKVNASGLHQSSTQSIPESKLFPSYGYVVIMPQQIQDYGWSNTAIVKCNGRQAATNGVNLAFVETIEEANYLVEYMKSTEFVEQALNFCGGMSNMTLGAMQRINMDDYAYGNISASV